MIETQFFTYGEEAETQLKLHTGERFGPVTLAYETHGALNADKSNAILVFHALSGSHHMAGITPEVPGAESFWDPSCQQGWWDDFVGPGKALDTDRFFIICANYLGGCYGSTGPASIHPETGLPYGGNFPHIHFGDIVDSQLPLFDHLGIDRFYAAIGSSLGAMMVMNFAVRYPERVDRVVPIAGGIEATTLTRAHNLEQILAVENDPNFNNGHYYDGPPPLRGLALARIISHKTFISLSDMEARMSDRCEQELDEFSWYKIKTPLESYILHQGRKFLSRFDANTYLHLIAGWSDYHLLRDTGFDDYNALFTRCRHQRYLVISIDSDVCFYPEEQFYTHEKLSAAGVRSDYQMVSSRKGHDSFLLEPDLYTSLIANLLEMPV